MSERIISYAYARDNGLFDGEPQDGVLPVFFRAGGNLAALAELRRVAGLPLKVEVVPAESFQLRLSEAFNNPGMRAASMVGDIEESADLTRLLEEMPDVEDLLDAEEDAPVIRLINTLLAEALRENASDIHFEMFESRATVRFRIDGQLRDIVEPKRGLHAALVSRLKVMAGLDIAEKRLPQDGRITLRIAGRPVDVRVSTLPTGHGERVVLRLLDKSAGRLDLAKLGMPAKTLHQLQHLLAQPHGILLVTGPTGSGKTTTLASMIDLVNTERNAHIITIEDPIEYLHPHKNSIVNQREVGADTASFAKALKYILRQDPDVVLIGEIRDLETVEATLQIAETGHLVFATLHTNSAVQTVNRIIDMFPPHQQGQVRAQLSFVLAGVLSQCLVPRASGVGRIMACEILIPTLAIRSLIRDDKVHQIYGQMQMGQNKYGMQTMNQALFSLLQQRVITQEEALTWAHDLDEFNEMLAGVRGGTPAKRNA